MRFATRFTQLRLQSFGAAVASSGRKDFSLPTFFLPGCCWAPSQIVRLREAGLRCWGTDVRLPEASLLEVYCPTGHIAAWQLSNLVFPIVYLGQRRLCLDTVLDYRLNSFFRMLRMLLRSGAYLSAAVGRSSGRKQGEPETLK